VLCWTAYFHLYVIQGNVMGCIRIKKGILHWNLILMFMLMVFFIIVCGPVNDQCVHSAYCTALCHALECLCFSDGMYVSTQQTVISYHIISYHIISYHIISYHIISYHIISYHIIYHIISCIISYHIISYHIISYHIYSPSIDLYRHGISHTVNLSMQVMCHTAIQ
jgi:hypothetical protein